MKISKNVPDLEKNDNKKRLLHLLSILTNIVLAIFTVWLVQAGPKNHWEKTISSWKVPVVYRLSKQKNKKSEPETVRLSLSQADLDLILNQQSVAEEKKLAPSVMKKLVRGQMTFGNKTYSVKIRLHGKHIYHFRSEDKFSLRVIIENPPGPFQLREFALVTPESRDFVSGAVFMDLLKDQGILRPLTESIRLELNERDMGVYQLEQTIDPEAIASQGRPLGPVIRFRVKRNCSSSQFTSLCLTNGNPSSQFESTVVMGTHPKTQVVSPEEKGSFERASSLLNGLKEGKIKTSQIFDIEKLTSFLALNTLMGSAELDYNDIYFYFNPISGVFEPVGKQIHAKHRAGLWWINENLDRKADFVNLFLGEDEVLEVYLKKLNEFSQPGFLESKLEGSVAKFKKLEALYQSEKPDYSFQSQKLLEIRNWIKEEINPLNPIQVFLRSSKIETGHPELSAFNVQSIPIKIISVREVNKAGKMKRQLKTESPWLFSKRSVRLGHIKEWPFQIPWAQFKPERIRIGYVTMGSPIIKETAPFWWTPDSYDYPKDARYLSSLSGLETHAKVDQQRRTAFFSGKVSLPQMVRIPSGYRVEMEAGTELVFAEGAGIVSQSPIQARGTEDRPIIIRGAKRGTHAAILLTKTRGTSIFKNVRFQDLEIETAKPLQGLEAPITLINSPSIWEQVEFVGLKGLSGISFVGTETNLNEVAFDSVTGNALAFLDTKSSLENLVLANITQSGLSLNFSEARIRNLKAKNIKSRVLSADRLSQLKASEIYIDGCGVGVFSSAASLAQIESFEMNQCNIGFEAIESKENSAGGRIIATAGSTQNVKREYIKQGKSHIRRDHLER